MHRLIARRLLREPALREMAIENIRRWTSQKEISESRREAVLEWKPILEGPLERLIAVLKDGGEDGQRLRQSSPFAGEAFIRQSERMRVIQKKRR